QMLGRDAALAQHAQVPMAVLPFVMHRINRVLLALQPVAVELAEHDLAKAILPREEFPARQAGRGLWPGIGFDADLRFEIGLRVRDVVVRLLEAIAFSIEMPAVIRAAQSAIFDVAVREIGAAMRTMPVEQAVMAALILIERQILTHQPNRL